MKSNYVRSVDLKWSLWSKDRDYWEEMAPGVWDWMKAWWEGNPDLKDEPRLVNTAPKKEIRYGNVEFAPMCAVVNFWSEFDDGGTESVTQFFGEEDAETFEELMALIDGCEEDLIALESEYVPEEEEVED